MKSNYRKSILFLFSLLLIITACKKDNVIPDNINNPDTSSNPLYSGNSISTSIGGVVTDQSGNPVSNAQVSVGNKTGYTNQDGIFNIINVSVDEKRAYVKITKSGYFLGSRSFKPSPNYPNYVRIELISKTSAGTINNSSGGTITTNGGAQIIFQAGDVSLANGNSYAGTVTVYASYLDPIASNIGEIMPGDLTAVDASNSTVVLETYGMIVVELVGSNGEALNVAPGKTVQIKMPVAAQQSASAPTSIPLWYFNEAQGNWVEEGQATLQGGFYNGEVSHFSFWNCDAPFPIIDFHCRLVCNGVPLINTEVLIELPSGTSNSGFTNGNGEVNGGIPQNTMITLKVRDECDDIIYTQNILTGSNNIDLGNISICNSINQSVISGNIVDCNGNGISNGMLTIDIGGGNTTQIFTNQNGAFNTIINVCSATSIEVTAYNFNNNQQGATLSVQTGTVINLGNLNTCNQIDEHIYFTIGTNDYAIVETGQNEVSSNYAADSTQIFGNLNPDYISISLINPILGNGTCQVNSVNNTQIVWPSFIDVNITNLGTTQGSYIEGTISGTIQVVGGSLETISGSFRTKNE